MTARIRNILAVLALIGLLLSGLGAPAVHAQQDSTLQVLVPALNVRQGPGTNYAIISLLRSGDTVPAVARNSATGWYQVKLSDGRLGWVSGLAAYVTVDQPDSLPEASAPAPAPAPVRVATSGRSSSVIVFQTSSGGAIYAINPDGSNLRQLTTGIDPALSPDGTQVAFTRWESSSNGAWGSVWVINVDGSGERAVLQNVHQPKSPTWSSDAKQLVISMQQGGIVENARQCGSRPPWGAIDIVGDGKGGYCWTLIADPNWGLRLIDVATGDFKDLPRDTHSFAPTWDPADSARVVYHGDHGLVNLDINQMTTSPLIDDVAARGPIFSPDGSRLAITYDQHDHWEVHVLNANGSGEVRLTETPQTALVDQQLAGQDPRSWNNAAPAWSPDGQRIAFLTDRTGSWDLWVMNADGSNQQPMFPAGTLNGITFRYDGVDERVISWR